MLRATLMGVAFTAVYQAWCGRAVWAGGGTRGDLANRKRVRGGNRWLVTPTR